MNSQLTISKLIEVLETFRNKHGDDVPVYHTELGSLMKTRVVFIYEGAIEKEETKNVVVLSG